MAIQPRSLVFYVCITVIALFTLSTFWSFRSSVPGINHFSQIVIGIGQSASCPNPFSSSLTKPPGFNSSWQTPALPENGRTCAAIPSAAPDFALTVCYHADYCNAVDVLIRRTSAADCAKAESRAGLPPLNNDTQLSSFVQHALGPDGFMIITDGCERQGVFRPSEYMGNCEYRFSLRLNNGGPFSLQIWHHYEEYSLFNENSPEWPVMKTEKVLLAPPLQLNVCPNCPTHYAMPSQTLARVLSAAPPQAQPLCSNNEPVYGTYIPMTYLESHSSAHFGFPLPPNQASYGFVPEEGCAFQHDGLRYAPHTACFSKHPVSILFAGDSHMRVAYDGIVHRLEGNQFMLTESEKAGSKNASFPNLEIQFNWDAGGYDFQLFSCENLEPYDIIGLEIGHHLHSKSSGEYTEHLKETLDHVTELDRTCARRARPRTLLYITPPAVAPREDPFVQQFKDRRTNVRIEHWARIGLDLARERGWKTVDMYTYSKGFARDTKDDAHFLETDALDPILDDIIAKLGICDL